MARSQLILTRKVGQNLALWGSSQFLRAVCWLPNGESNPLRHTVALALCKEVYASSNAAFTGMDRFILQHRVNQWIQTIADHCSPSDNNGLADSARRRRAPLRLVGPAVPLQELRPKTLTEFLRARSRSDRPTRHYGALTFRESYQCWAGGRRIRSDFTRCYARLSKEGFVYVDKPIDRKWTPLGPTD